MPRRGCSCTCGWHGGWVVRQIRVLIICSLVGSCSSQWSVIGHSLVSGAGQSVCQRAVELWQSVNPDTARPVTPRVTTFAPPRRLPCDNLIFHTAPGPSPAKGQLTAGPEALSVTGGQPVLPRAINSIVPGTKAQPACSSHSSCVVCSLVLVMHHWPGRRRTIVVRLITTVAYDSPQPLTLRRILFVATTANVARGEGKSFRKG